MSLRRFPPTNPKAEADQSSTGNDRTPPYTSNVTSSTTAPYTLSDRDSMRQPGSSLTDTLGVAKKSKVATTNYIYYRIYAEDGAIPSKTPFAAGDPFLARIKARSVPPPRNARTVKCGIATVENIKDGESTSLFLTPYCQSPMDDADKVIILNGAGPGSTPQEPLALVAKMSDSERSALESDGRGGFASSAGPDTVPLEVQYLYYLLYVNNYEMPSKVAFDPEEPSLGRIRADSVAPPHCPTSIKRCISRVERNPALVYAELFADTSCDTPLKEGHISILRNEDPGLSPDEPMAIVQVKHPLIPDGKYLIKNRASDIYWSAYYIDNLMRAGPHVYSWCRKLETAKGKNFLQWDIIQDANGNISMTSSYAPSLWVGTDMTGSTLPVPWRWIPADSKSYYLTTDVNRFSQNPRVPAYKGDQGGGPVSMATLKEGDQTQMWEFIRI